MKEYIKWWRQKYKSWLYIEFCEVGFFVFVGFVWFVFCGFCSQWNGVFLKKWKKSDGEVTSKKDWFFIEFCEVGFLFFGGFCLICCVDLIMGGCFPCFRSSHKESGNGVKEVVKKESFKDGSAAQSIHLSKVNSGVYLILLLYFCSVCFLLCWILVF